jgi:hypothetical protein
VKCVVMEGQIWRDPLGVELRVASIVVVGFDAWATFWLVATGALSTVRAKASVMCAGDSGWTRRPDSSDRRDAER